MRPAKSPYLITAPTEHERCYALVVALPHLRPQKSYALKPWLRITANCQTDEITVAAGITCKREDD